MSNLSDQQIRDIFNLFDADSSGRIDTQELSLVLEALGFGALPKEEIDAILKEIDTDASGNIEFEEFRKLCKARMSQKDSPEEVWKAFKAFDAKSTGRVTADDFVRVAKEIGECRDEAGLREIFDEIVREAGGDSGLTFEHWRTIMREAVTDKRHKIDDAAYNIKSRAKVAKKTPYGTKVEAGKTYYWCVCGYSKTQPFCDGAHVKVNKDNGSNFQPVKFEATQDKTVWFCGCKQTKSPPFCDGTHTSL